MKNNGHVEKMVACIHLKVVDYRHKISKQSKTENGFAADPMYIPKNFLGILRLLETLVWMILAAVAFRNNLKLR